MFLEVKSLLCFNPLKPDTSCTQESFYFMPDFDINHCFDEAIKFHLVQLRLFSMAQYQFSFKKNQFSFKKNQNKTSNGGFLF